jgi:hypothetical protein
MKQKTKGRPKGSGKYGEETKPLRVPVSLWDKVIEFIKKEMAK